MPLTGGTRLGSYEVLALIGSGGMGEVYRAKDTRLKREVAIKILPDAFANDPDRLARFQREAELLATLNHPNIGSVYGFEHAPPHESCGVLNQRNAVVSRPATRPMSVTISPIVVTIKPTVQRKCFDKSMRRSSNFLSNLWSRLSIF